MLQQDIDTVTKRLEGLETAGPFAGGHAAEALNNDGLRRHMALEKTELLLAQLPEHL